jgi:sortase (surface protein transpeptidase)
MPAPATSAAPATSSAPRPARRPAGATAPLSLAVPDLGIATGPLIPLGLLDDGTLEVPPDARGVGWYVHSPVPGDAGPSVIAAHVDYAGRLGVFAHLGRLQPGAAVTVTRPDGRPARFTVYRVERFPKASFPAGAVYGDTTGPELRLITCGGSFDAATGNYRDNVVAFARAA